MLRTWRGSTTAPRGADAEPHLGGQCAGPMAIAVDRHRHTAGDGLADTVTVEIDVAGRAVHLRRGARFDGGGEHRVEVERITREPADEAVRGMAEHVDGSGCRSAPSRALGEPRGVVPCRIVQRGQHDIEAGEGLVGEIQVAAGVDVDLDAAGCHRGVAAAQRRVASRCRGISSRASVRVAPAPCE